jgi:D-glycero-alpha-D-manno-heptose-7-phosphate kinase
MIIVRVPFRLPLGGGGTDLPAYCKEFGGRLITASINKFMYISINEPATSDKIKLYYRYSEIVGDASEIEHNIIRESLKLHNINRPIEIGSMADIEAGTGMGSSSAFTVGLLAGLNTIERKFISPIELAEEACKVEIDMVGKPIGKQDQYAVALGGVNQLNILPTGQVFVNPMRLKQETIFELENRLLMFYTGITRNATEVLSDPMPTEDMHKIKNIGVNIELKLHEGNITRFGNLLHDHWTVKRSISKMTNGNINEWYETALLNGALGGKIMGAGGGGFLLLCAKEGRRKALKSAMEDQGLRYMDFRFEFEGVKVIANY